MEKEMKNGIITLALTNCQAVLEDGILFDACILIAGDRIAAVDKAENITVPEGAEIIDAKGRYVGPGFVDIHVHGVNGKNINFETEEVAEYYLTHGTTSILASPWYKLDFETFLSAIRSVKENMKKAPTVKGFYMEGPYTNQKYGSHAAENPWREGIKEDEMRALVDEAGGYAKVWTIAPELENIRAFCEYAKGVNPGTVLAVGHSEATPMQIKALGRYKPTLATHTTNATGKISGGGGVIGYGPDEFALKDPEVFCELISDSRGIHVHREIQQLILHAKGVDKVVLITDGSLFGNPPPPKYKGVTDLNFSPAGEIAGSKLTMNVACKNVMSHTRVGITEAFLMASRNPARVIGLDSEIGTVEAGKIADLVIVDDRFNVEGVILGGKKVR